MVFCTEDLIFLGEIGPSEKTLPRKFSLANPKIPFWLRAGVIVQIFLPIRGRVNRASASETVDSGSVTGRVKSKTVKNWYSQLP